MLPVPILNYQSAFAKAMADKLEIVDIGLGNTFTLATFNCETV
jgi:hypothetical protein